MQNKTKKSPTKLLLKTSDHFKIGKHTIGYVSDRFKELFLDQSFEKRSAPTFQKLGRNMTDAEIESELKPGLCELGDVLAFLENPPEGTKDGWSNLFYLASCVVYVGWGSYVGRWGVGAWIRDGSEWLSGYRVFSLAIGSGALTPQPSGSLTLELAIKMVKKEGYQVSKIL